ncbi:hypothetical protein C2857_005045 [Epichloe festucae Fl1]|uniref:Uncharacterized protein n=1 Tax=Epichloe festucae (strain Fl1) TaxID=877507 RepID=A0A7U3Q3W8_EPIFF|nr:hypothetical protein C2857_005045 [Epichloe festucae Fl1]
MSPLSNSILRAASTSLFSNALQSSSSASCVCPPSRTSSGSKPRRLREVLHFASMDPVELVDPVSMAMLTSSECSVEAAAAAPAKLSWSRSSAAARRYLSSAAVPVSVWDEDFAGQGHVSLFAATDTMPPRRGAGSQRTPLPIFPPDAIRTCPRGYPALCQRWDHAPSPIPQAVVAARARHERPLPGNLRDEREQRRRARPVDDVGAKVLLEVLRGAAAAVAGVPDEMPLRSVAPQS